MSTIEFLVASLSCYFRLHHQHILFIINFQFLPVTHSFISKPFCRLLIKASGSGDYWGDYQDVKCKVYFKAEPYHKDDDERTYLNVESVKMDFSVKDIEMGVENDNNNRVIRKLDEYLHWH